MKEEGELEADLCKVLGFFYCRQGKLSEAARALNRLMELQPASPAVRVVRAQALQMAGQGRQAMKEVEATLALDPNDEEATKLKGQLSS